ncbi:hypothetical protein QJS10_CPA01g02813 [Acorus calamus]|uniref:HMA domain-containing protein n=1 Tax=Acorus calamus TaxID=4465 RepID=A0AAV9FIF0_ACOCL|nr:hypothetical protein QJS10_CPA01g02813 [Acorus calamus]
MWEYLQCFFTQFVHSFISTLRIISNLQVVEPMVGMHCKECAKKIKKAIKKIDGKPIFLHSLLEAILTLHKYES